MSYSAKPDANYEGISIPSLPPGIHKGFELSDFKVDTAKKQDGTIGKRIMTFTFTGPDNAGYQHTEWEVLPTDNDSDKKSDNQVIRVGHILRKFVPEDVVKAGSYNSWETFTAWVTQTLGSPQSWKGVKLDLKILGNVYNGKATAAFPGYLPFVVKSGETLGFSAKEISANDAYFKAIAATPDQEGTIGVPASTVADTDF